MAVNGRVAFVLVVGLLALLVWHVNAHGSGGLPSNCHQADYGRDAYVDCSP